MRSARRRGILNRFATLPNITLVGEDSDVIAGGFRIVTWLSSGSITVDGPLNVEYLVVAGGGGGVPNSTGGGGGGGAGGLLASSLILSATTTNVAVGRWRRWRK
jgi:hypothetical protein